MDIAEFLLARIAEDEAEVKFVVESSGWMLDVHEDPSDETPPVLTISTARVLAECEAKRRVVKEHRQVKGESACRCCFGGFTSPGKWPCTTLQLLATPYIDHPDYDPAWRVP
jgi:hypothetical protein